MPYTPCAITGAANPSRFRVGNSVRFIDAPIQAQFVSAGTTGKITGKVGCRAFEVTCDGHALAVIDFPENLEKHNGPEAPYTVRSKFISRRK